MIYFGNKNHILPATHTWNNPFPKFDRSSYSQERDVNFIEGLHNKALLTIIEDTEKAFTDLKGKLNSVLEEIERNIVDELKEGIEGDLKSLKEQLENQKESIKMTELGIEEVDACLKMM